uniref:Sulfite oxidase n=1 Tax=Soboliphyme baturini TaxID=241478 RepID=A0A183IQ39_9BILA
LYFLGASATRCVKWVRKIKVSEEESQSFWQQRDYKSFSPSVDWSNADFQSTPAIIDFPVQSVICVPEEGKQYPAGTEFVNLKGYALSGGGRGIIRVDVSSDGGETWHTADLEQATDQKLFKMWAWTLWSCRVPLDRTRSKDGHYQLVCKAIDYGYNSQPETSKGIWNFRGFLNNSWHRVNITVK